MELKGGHGGNRLGDRSRRLIAESYGERGLLPPPDPGRVIYTYILTYLGGRAWS